MTHCNQRPSSELEVLNLSLPKAEEERVERPSNQRVPPYGLGRGKVILTPPHPTTRTPQIPPPRMKPHLTVSAVGRDPSSHPKKPPTGRKKRILVAGTATGPSSHHSQRKKNCRRSRGPSTTSPASDQPCPPSRNGRRGTRHPLKRANRERYHLAAYELQDEMWNEEKRFDAAYVKKVTEMWGISDHPMSDDRQETEKHPWNDPKNTEESVIETL